MPVPQSATSYFEAGSTPEIVRRHRCCIGASFAAYIAGVGFFVLATIYGLPAPPQPPGPPPVVIIIDLQQVPEKKPPHHPPPTGGPLVHAKLSKDRILDFEDDHAKLEAVLKKFNGWVGFGTKGILDRRFRFAASGWAEDPVPPGEDTTDDYSSFDLGEAFALPHRLCSGALCAETKYALFPVDQWDKIEETVKAYASQHRIACVQKARLVYDDRSDSGFTVTEPIVPCSADQTASQEGK